MPARRKGRKVPQKKKRNASKKATSVTTVTAATTTTTTTTRKRKAVFPSLTDDATDGSNSASDDSNRRMSDDDDNGDGSDIGVRSSRHEKDKSKRKGKGKSIARVTRDSESDEDLEEGGADDEEDDMQWEDVLNVISAPEAVGTEGSGPSSTPNPKRDLELTLNRGRTEFRYLPLFQSRHAI